MPSSRLQILLPALGPILCLGWLLKVGENLPREVFDTNDCPCSCVKVRVTPCLAWIVLQLLPVAKSERPCGWSTRSAALGYGSLRADMYFKLQNKIFGPPLPHPCTGQGHIKGRRCEEGSARGKGKHSV